MNTTSDAPTSLTVPSAAGPGGRRSVALPIAVVALLLLTAGAVVELGRSSGSPIRTEPPAAATTPLPAPPAGAARAGSRPPATPSRTAPPAATRPFGTPFAYQPLFPFASLDEARAWQTSANDGHQPWHLDAEATALGFAGYLGYTEIDRVTSHTGDNTDAHVGVGYPSEGGRTGTAAIVHLRRFGTGVGAPWEVVGTADTDLTVTSPGYGATVTSPFSIGGRISGADEAIHAQVRQLSSSGPLGESCCPPAGGDRTPWHTTLSFHGATDRVLTVSVSTGGHLQAVERFAVTAVRVS